jgi:hypothetical protein
VTYFKVLSHHIVGEWKENHKKCTFVTADSPHEARTGAQNIGPTGTTTAKSKVCHWTQSWGWLIQIHSTKVTPFRTIFMLSPHSISSGGYFPKGFLTTVPYVFLVSPIYTTRPAHCNINLTTYKSESPHRRYLYFDVVVGLAKSNDSESYAGSSVASGRASHAGTLCWGIINITHKLHEKN